MNSKETREKFEAFANHLIEECELDFILDRIPYDKMQEIMEDWQEEKEKEQEEADARADLKRKEMV